MYISVDDDSQEENMLKGFSYTAKSGYKEFVHTGDDKTITVENDSGVEVEIYIEDIPKLIKALQAAYDHINKEK